MDCSFEDAAGVETEKLGGAGDDICCKFLKNGFLVSASEACGEVTLEAGADGGVGAITTGGGGAGDSGV